MKFDPYTIKWFYGASRGKNHAVLFVDAVGTLSMRGQYPEKIYGFPYAGKYYLQCEGSRTIGQEDHDAMEKALGPVLKKNPDFFYEWGVRMEKLSHEIRRWTDKVKNTGWKKLTNEEIMEVIYSHCVFQAKLWAVPLAYLYYFYFNDKIVEEFIRKARGRLGEKFDKLLPAILAQEKTSEVAEEKRELLRLAVGTVASGRIDEKKLKKHWKKFAYLNNYYYWGEGYSLADIRARLADETRKGKRELEKEKAVIAPKPLDYALFTKKEAGVIRSMKKLAHGFQYADESLAYAIHNIRGVYNEAARRLGVSYNEFVSMTIPEIKESLKKRGLAVPKSELNERYKEHTVIIVGDQSIILTGAQSGHYKERIEEKGDTAAQEFKGTVAFKGGVLRGRVHIISHADEISSFKRGEVLVTPMTNPSFVPAMQKALVIITNDGGLLCHAAIVSRELKIPCVIGTKVATKVLKDGDMVEVDANRGIVKIIK